MLDCALVKHDLLPLGHLILKGQQAGQFSSVFLFYFNFFSLVQTEFNRRKMQISFCPFIMTAVCVCLLWPFLDADLTVNFFKFFVRRCDSNKWNNKFQLVCSLKGTSAFCVCLIVNTVHVYIGIFKANTVWEFFSIEFVLLGGIFE